MFQGTAIFRIDCDLAAVSCSTILTRAQIAFTNPRRQNKKGVFAI